LRFKRNVENNHPLIVKGRWDNLKRETKMGDVASVHTGSKIDLEMVDYNKYHFDLYEKAMLKQDLNPSNYTLIMK
jgi:hypothetical protein